MTKVTRNKKLAEMSRNFDSHLKPITVWLEPTFHQLIQNMTRDLT